MLTLPVVLNLPQHLVEEYNEAEPRDHTDFVPTTGMDGEYYGLCYLESLDILLKFLLLMLHRAEETYPADPSVSSYNLATTPIIAWLYARHEEER